MMSPDNIEKLYENYDILADAKDTIFKHEKEYLEILAAVKGSDKEKCLASQFIAKFFSYFPHLAEQAIEIQLQLCEDVNVAVRKQAIKDMPVFCKAHKENTQRIADILSRLLQSDDNTEIILVTNSLTSVLKNDPKEALAGIFTHIHRCLNDEVTNEVVRGRCIKLLASKVQQLGREIINKEAEDLIIFECKKILENVVAEEFEHIMALLTWSRLGKTPAGKKELVQLVAALAFSQEDWHPEDPEYADRIIQCSRQALPLFSYQVDSSQFVKFFCNHVLACWDFITIAEGDADAKLELLKIFAEITEFCGEVEIIQENITTVYDILMHYLPEAPFGNVENSADKQKQETETGQEKNSATPSLQFSHMECILFALHSLCRKSPETLGADTGRLKTLRLRLQYTASLTQAYMKKLKAAAQDRKGLQYSEEIELQIAALKTMSNINILMIDMFRTPLRCNIKVQLSFQSSKNPEKEEKQDTTQIKEKLAVQKRYQPITFDSFEEKLKIRTFEIRAINGGNIYIPPFGKYSSKLTTTDRFSGPSPGRAYGRRKVQHSFQSTTKHEQEEKQDTTGIKEKLVKPQKRHRPIDNHEETFPSEKRARSSDNIYIPPFGKYSSKLNSTDRFSGPNPGRTYGKRKFRNNGVPYRPSRFLKLTN